MAVIFDTDRSTITKHINNIYEWWELEEKATCAKIAQVQKEWDREVKREITYYNLDAIIAVWYRVSSKRATAFRIRATQILKEYLIKGFAMDDERLKNPQQWDYYDELIERIREIRTSEKRLYQKITDIYATSIDYDTADVITKGFFATVQNKIHYAIHGQTAAEVIYDRVDADKPQLGMTSWKGDVPKRIDTHIAKNYLEQSEIETLQLLVEQYLAYAELQAKRKEAMTMQSRKDKLDEFLTFNQQQLLDHAWLISTQQAKEKADGERSKRKNQYDLNYTNDFDQYLEELK